jgi:hypothetical protein
MSGTPRSAGDVVADRDNTRLYAGVIVVEAAVLLAIWIFQRYFGS